MILCFFAAFSFSAAGAGVVNSTHSVLVISSFGFNDGSTFHFKIKTEEESRLLLYLLTFQKARITTESQVFHACTTFDNTFISDINQTDNVTAKEYQWSGTIPERNVYYPVFVNCLSNSTRYNISYKYVNGKYLIDYRNENFSLIMLIYSFVNMIIATIWLTNTYFYKSFFIPLQLAFALLPSIRAIKCIVESKFWELKKTSDNLSMITEYFIEGLSAVFLDIFLSTTTLVFSGWCVFRVKYYNLEMYEIIASATLFVLGFYIGLNAYDTRSALAAIVMNIFGFLWYLEINGSYFLAFLRILDAEVSNERTIRRINLVRNFSVTTIVAMSIAIILHSTAAAVETAEIFQTSIFEFCIIVLEIVELFFFFLRKEYEGESTNDDEGEMLSSPYVLSCPNQNILCVLQKPSKPHHIVNNANNIINCSNVEVVRTDDIEPLEVDTTSQV